MNKFPNWIMIECIFTLIRCLFGLVANEDFRTWFAKFALGTLIIFLGWISEDAFRQDS
jgi:hypothetical protein